MFTGEPFFSWKPELGARIGVLPRLADGDKIKWFDVDPCFIFHVFNAYEVGDDIQLLACRYPEYPAALDLGKQVESDVSFDQSPVAYRWTLNMKTGETTEAALDDVSAEFPRVDDALTGVKHQYGYAVTAAGENRDFLKYDFESGKSVQHTFGKGRSTAEGVFVARPDSKQEDDGYLVSFVFDEIEQRSEFVVVDCRQFDQPPVARVILPRRIPFGFHGLWLDGDVLKNA